MPREIPRVAPCPIARNKWQSVPVYTKCALLQPIGYNNESIYVAEADPTADDVTQGQYRKVRNGVVILFGPEERWVYIDDAQGPATPLRFMKYELGDNPDLLAQFIAAGGNLPIGGSGGAADTANADTNADFTKTLIGLLSNARIAAFKASGGGDWVTVSTEAPSVMTGEGHATQNWIRAAAALFGRDTSDNSMRSIEARGSSANQSASVYRLLVDTCLRAAEINVGGYDPLSALREITGVAGSALAVLEQRDRGYWPSRQGRRFVATSEGTAITVSNGFTATAPRMTIEAGATNELILHRIEAYVLVAGTTNLQIRVVIDPDARYSSGGTAGTVGARTNKNGGSSNAGSYTFHYGGITATATDADEREIHYGTIVNVTGNKVTIDFEDDCIIPASGTALIYLMDAGAVGTVALNVTLEDANIQ